VKPFSETIGEFEFHYHEDHRGWYVLRYQHGKMSGGGERRFPKMIDARNWVHNHYRRYGKKRKDP
jgi:hypothetical protein